MSKKYIFWQKTLLFLLFCPILSCSNLVGTETINVYIIGKVEEILVTVNADVRCQGTKPVSSTTLSAFSDNVNILSEDSRGEPISEEQAQAVCNGETVLLSKEDSGLFTVEKIEYKTPPSEWDVWSAAVKAANSSVEVFQFATERNDAYSWYAAAWAMVRLSSSNRFSIGFS